MPGKKSASWQLVVFVMWLKNDTKRQKTMWNCQNQNRRKYSPDQQSYFFCCHRYWNFSRKDLYIRICLHMHNFFVFHYYVPHVKDIASFISFNLPSLCILLRMSPSSPLFIVRFVSGRFDSMFLSGWRFVNIG